MPHEEPAKAARSVKFEKDVSEYKTPLYQVTEKSVLKYLGSVLTNYHIHEPKKYASSNEIRAHIGAFVKITNNFHKKRGKITHLGPSIMISYGSADRKASKILRKLIDKATEEGKSFEEVWEEYATENNIDIEPVKGKSLIERIRDTVSNSLNMLSPHARGGSRKFRKSSKSSRSGKSRKMRK